MGASDLTALFLYFVLLSFLAVGGYTSVLPEMHRYVVETHRWLTDEQFATAFVLAQLSPGPNAMYVTLVGWKVAGWPGAIAAVLALLAPVCTITILVARMHARNPDAPLARAFRRGLAPVALGLFFASAWILARSVNEDWRGYVLMLLTVVAALRTPWNPLWFLAAGAVVGMTDMI